MKELLAHDTMAGEVSIEASRRPAIKINSKPRIVVCVPIGTKHQVHMFPMPDGSRYATLATAVPGCTPVQWTISNMNLVPPLSTSQAYLFQWGLLSGEARQVMTTRALEMVQDDGYILYWDDDVIAEPLALYTLYSFMEQHPKVGMVTGVYTTRQDPVEPLIFKEPMKGVHWGLTVGPKAVPEEISGCGAGFMLARVQAVRDMVAANPDVPIWADSKMVLDGEESDAELPFKTTWGHDLRFCRLMAEAGWPVYVDGRVELGHFDATEQCMYRLPDDSAPKRRGRGEEI